MVIAGEGIIVNVRPDVVRLILAADETILFIDKQTLIVVPRIDVAGRCVRRAFEAAALPLFIGEAKSIAEKMLIAELRIHRCLKVELSMIDIVHVAQLVLAFVDGLAFIVDERYIVLAQICIVHLDVPVTRVAETLPTDIVGIAPCLPLEMLLRLQIRICTLNIADEILAVAIHAKLKAVVRVCIVGADQTDARRVSIVAQCRRAKIPLAIVKGKPALLSVHARIDGHNIAFAARQPHTEFTHLSRICTQKKVRERQTAVALFAQPFDIELKPRLFRRLARDDVDDTADGIGTVLRTRSPLDNLNAFDIFCAKTHDLVRRAGILCKVA